MMSLLVPLSFLFLIIAGASAYHNLDYSDLEALGITCSPRDDCESPGKRTFNDTSCECDPDCHVYNDCCINARRYTDIEPEMVDNVLCLVERNEPKQGVYAISTCLTNWTGHHTIRSKCERANDRSDPLLAAPVTNVFQNVTYRNRYCSECNSANEDDLISWIIRVNCNSLADVANVTGNVTEEFIMDNIFFKTTYPHRNEWGVNVWDSDLQREVFHRCRMNYSLPSYLEPHVRFCRPGLMSSCPLTYRRTSVIRKCASYMAIVWTNTRSYRNPHCALCNNVDLSTLNCPVSLASRSKTPMSFALLLDVNLSDGNRVGYVRCPAKEKYDSFSKKCRALVCAFPGYSIVNDRCVRA